MLTNLALSEHIRTDRLQRATDIAMTIGFGGKIVKIAQGRGNRKRAITDTGVLLILRDNLIITCYIPTIDQLTAIYQGEQIPKELKHKVKDNIKKYNKYLALH